MDNHGDHSGAPDLNQIVSDARRELASTEVRLSGLYERVHQMAASALQEHSELQRFLEEFALQPAINGGPDESRPGTGPLFDLEKVRSGSEELTNHVTRTSALQANLAAVVQTLQDAIDHLSHDNAFRPVQQSPDVRFQQAMNAAREEERRRLAREIHDGPAQVLANAVQAVYTAEEVAKRSPDQIGEELRRLREYLKDGSAEIRRFMFDLRPAMLQDFGLGPTLRRYIDDYAVHFGRKIGMQIGEPLPQLTHVQELQVFRIVQESLQNVHKHAGQEAAVQIQLGVVNGLLRLVVSDTGRGFEPANVTPRASTGAGLPGMRERAKVAGGDLSITSSPGEGTVVELELRLPGQTGYLR